MLNGSDTPVTSPGPNLLSCLFQGTSEFFDHFLSRFSSVLVFYFCPDFIVSRTKDKEATIPLQWQGLVPCTNTRAASLRGIIITGPM